MREAFNNRILVIDDEETIRDSFKRILADDNLLEQELDQLKQMGNDLFDELDDEPDLEKSYANRATFSFQLDLAANGQKGYDLVKASLADNHPYAAIFVDMRMPGWSGLETVQHIRNIDKRTEIIFVTAYSDYSIKEIINKAGINISYHCKPFAVEEIEQIATKAVYEWNKARELEELIQIISNLRGQHWQLKPLLNNILNQVAELLGTHSAAMAVKDSNNTYNPIITTGTLIDSNATDYLKEVPETLAEDFYFSKNFAYFGLESYGVLAVFETVGQLKTDRIYLIRLFLEQAAEAIRNIEVQEQLLRSEKLSALGQGVTMINHDLKDYISSIQAGVDSIAEEINNKDYIVEMVSLLQNQLTNCLDFINDIRDFSRQSSVIKQIVSIPELVSNVQLTLNHFFSDSNVTFSVNCQSNASIQADSSKLKRVLVNLLKNAFQCLIDFNIQDGMVRLLVSEQENYVVFVVEDNGPGISDELKPKIFEPFSTYNKKSGSGLGLAIVKQFIEAHSGQISVQSELEKGTSFTVKLPMI